MGVAIAAHRLDCKFDLQFDFDLLNIDNRDDYYCSVVEALSGYEDMDETDLEETDVSGKFLFSSLLV